MAKINDLSNQTLHEIFSYLKIGERQRFARVCKRWNSLIESMWYSEDKLILHRCPPAVFYGTGNCPTIFCRNYSFMEKVLKKFDGNLKKLIIKTYSIRMEWSDEKKIEVRRFCDEIQTNYQLETLKIDIDAWNEAELDVLIMVLQSIPTENLRDLHLSTISFDINGKLIKTIETLLEKTALKYLHLDEYTSTMVEIINKMDSLESLTLMNCKDISPTNSLLYNITKLPYLQELIIYDPRFIDDEFLNELGNNCKSLLLLDLYCGTGEKITQSGFDAIGNLVNLKKLSFIADKPLNYQILYNLTELEYLNLLYEANDDEYEIQEELLHILNNLPKLEECYFKDKHHRVYLRRSVRNNLLRFEQRHLPIIIWNRIFGLLTEDPYMPW